ncbi:MAG: hypothetical protein M3M85_00540 [bacterium]|nr:hypothetical protein [bacterium]
MGKEEIRFGIGERAFNQLPEGQKEQKIPVAQVKNIVSYVNDKIDLPFKLELNEGTDLGVFFSPIETGKSLKVHSKHKRSALLGRVIFKDKENRIYRDVDIKGLGCIAERDDPEVTVSNEFFVDNEAQAKKKKGGEISETGPWGFCLNEYALRDQDMSENLLEVGIRTYRVAAIIKLMEAIDNEGKVISIDEAKRLGILRESDEPVLEVRAYSTKMRVANLTEPVHLRDAMVMVAQELGRTEISEEEYARWFASTLGQQIARMHKFGYVHRGLYYHNITTDCRIVDLDSVMATEELSPEEFLKYSVLDMDEGKGTLYFLATSVLKDIPKTPSFLQQLLGEYKNSYKNELEAKL